MITGAIVDEYQKMIYSYKKQSFDTNFISSKEFIESGYKYIILNERLYNFDIRTKELNEVVIEPSNSDGNGIVNPDNPKVLDHFIYNNKRYIIINNQIFTLNVYENKLIIDNDLFNSDSSISDLNIIHYELSSDNTYFALLYSKNNIIFVYENGTYTKINNNIPIGDNGYTSKLIGSGLNEYKRIPTHDKNAEDELLIVKVKDTIDEYLSDLKTVRSTIWDKIEPYRTSVLAHHDLVMKRIDRITDRITSPAYIANDISEYINRMNIHKGKSKDTIMLTDGYDKYSKTIIAQHMGIDSKIFTLYDNKLILHCNKNEFIKIMDIDYDESGKLLVEVVLCSPELIFKGIIGTCPLDDSTIGIGFFSEYLVNKYPNVTLHAREHIKDDGTKYVSIYISNRDLEQIDYETGWTHGNDVVKYTTMFPLDIHATYLSGSPIGINGSLTKTVDGETLESALLLGYGDLNQTGHGPIDCNINYDTLKTTPYLPKYYTKGKEYISKYYGKVITDDKHIFRHLVYKTKGLYTDNPSRDIYSHIMRKAIDLNDTSDYKYPFFDIASCMKIMHGLKTYMRFNVKGIVIVNGMSIPVIKMELNCFDESEMVAFTIDSRYRLNADDTVKIDEARDSEMIRNPKIVFSTIDMYSIGLDHNGFVGDVGEDRSETFRIGQADVNVGIFNKYNVSLIDIVVLDQLNQLRPIVDTGDSFRYTTSKIKMSIPVKIPDELFEDYAYPNIGVLGKIKFGKTIPNAGLPDIPEEE